MHRELPPHRVAFQLIKTGIVFADHRATWGTYWRYPGGGLIGSVLTGMVTSALYLAS